MYHIQYRMLHGYVMLYGIVLNRTMQCQVALRRIVPFPNVFYSTVFHILSMKRKSHRKLIGPRSEQKDTNKVAKRKSHKATTLKALSLMSTVLCSALLQQHK